MRPSHMDQGYLHYEYARSLSDIGEPLRLPNSRGWLLVRPVSGGKLIDATGCYPIFCCREWGRLVDDLAELKGLITVSMVADPFGNHSEALLRTCFPHVVPYKRHFVVDLHDDPATYVSRHHLRNVRLGLKTVTTERCPVPEAHADEWTRLYTELIRRHAIRGPADFSPEGLVHQLSVPGVEAFRARLDGKTVGMLLWMTTNQVSYYHLSAFSEPGYAARASFALWWHSIEHFRSMGLRWLSLGGVPGLQDSPQSGLLRFKQGWATGTRMAYFCGRIYDREAYARLRTRNGEGQDDYFPAYRLHDK
jgi:hypothetical protein